MWKPRNACKSYTVDMHCNEGTNAKGQLLEGFTSCTCAWMRNRRRVGYYKEPGSVLTQAQSTAFIASPWTVES